MFTTIYHALFQKPRIIRCIENETWLAHTECRVNPLYPVSNKKLSISLINKSIENLYNCSMIIPWSQYPSLLDLLNRYAIHMPSSN